MRICSGKPLLFFGAVIGILAFLCGCGDKEQKAPVINIMSPESLTVIPNDDMQAPSPAPFCESDLCISDRLLLGMTPSYVRSTLGDPVMEQTADSPDYGSVDTFTYEGLRLGFYDVQGLLGQNHQSGSPTLSDVICRTNKITFARGLHVGCTAKEVMASFADDKTGKQLHLLNSVEPNGRMLYGEDIGGRQHEDLYHYAYIDKSALYAGDADYYSIIYCFDKPLIIFGGEGEANLCEKYSLVFYVDADNEAVTEIRLLHTAANWTQTAHLPE
jgi:hypothetical protein